METNNEKWFLCYCVQETGQEHRLRASCREAAFLSLRAGLDRGEDVWVIGPDGKKYTSAEPPAPMQKRSTASRVVSLVTARAIAEAIMALGAWFECEKQSNGMSKISVESDMGALLWTKADKPACPPLEVHAVSSKHISDSTTEWLRNQCRELSDARSLDAAESRAGFWMYAHGEYGDDYPADICMVFDWCHANNISYILIDYGAEPIASLPTYE